MMTLVMVLIFIFIGIPYAFLSSNAAQKEYEEQVRKNEDLEQQLTPYATYSSYKSYYDSDVLEVKSRGKMLSQAFQMRNKEKVTFAYQPTTYIYTSATVGRVTTGGVEKTGGSNSVVRRKMTAKCQLLYCGHEVRSIYLTDELYKKAQKSKIQHYLDSNKKRIIIVDEKKLNAIVPMASVLGTNDATVLNRYGDLEIEASRPQSECTEIIDWLCEEN